MPEPMPFSQVIAVGGANMDVTAVAAAALLAGDSNPGSIACSAGGVARNAAENLLRLGIPTALLSVFGQDALGQALWQHCVDCGLDMRASLRLDAARTATYLSLQGRDGDMAVAINDMEILERLDVPCLVQQTPALRAADCWLLDANLTPAALRYLLGAGWDAHTPARPPVFADGVSVAKCPRLLPHLSAVHTLKLNRLEAQSLTQCGISDAAQAQATACTLQRLGAYCVLISLGADGVAWCDAQHGSGYQAARAVPVRSTRGAGDALLSGMVYAHLQGMTTAQAVDWAMACAELTLSSTLANAPELSVAAINNFLCAHASQPHRSL